MNILFEFLLLGAIAGACVFAFLFLKTRMPGNTPYLVGLAVALVTAFLLFWVNGAVGILGSADNKANLLIFGVLAVGLAGARIVRFKPRGMAHTLFATASSQVFVALVAVLGGLGGSDAAGSRNVFILTAFYTTLWLASAVLF